MKDIYEEKEIEELSEKVLSSVREKVKEQIGDAVYYNLSAYLYEHYTGNKNKIEKELIDSITEEYVKNPTDYKFAKLREKMFKENKDLLVKTLTNEAIQKSVEDVIMEYTHRDYHFKWQWREGIAKFILNNWDNFKDDKIINEMFGRELEQKQSRINWLEEKLREVSDVLEN